MYRKLRYQKRAIPLDRVMEILRKNEHGVLATINPDGEPCATALNYVLFKENILYFHGAKEGEKIENIQFAPKATFLIIEESQVLPERATTTYQSVCCHGKASLVLEDKEFQKGLRLFMDRFCVPVLNEEEIKAYLAKHEKRTALIRFEIDSITGKGNH